MMKAASSIGKVLLVLSVGGLGVASCGGAWAAENAALPPPSRPVLSALDVAFKLDTRLTRSLYMGDRWVSPPTHAVTRRGESATVEARVEGVDTSGRRLAISPRWLPEDPSMVTVTPAEASQVRITVRGAGESRLHLTASGVSRNLFIKAVRKDDAIQVAISQVAPEDEERARLLGGRTQRASYAIGIDFGRGLTRRSVNLDVDLFSQALREALSMGGTPPTMERKADPLSGDQTTRDSLVAGAELGGKLRTASAEVDAGLVVRGVADALRGGQALLTESELQAGLAGLQMDSREKRAEARMRIAAQNKKDGEAFLAENKTKDGVVALASGLQYRILRDGDGRKPAPDDVVACHFRGTLVDGTEFDSTHGEPLTIPVNRAIRGWREALPLMPVGAKWQLFVPSRLAYGVRGAAGKVGPNATLVFEVELLAIQETKLPTVEPGLQQARAAAAP